MDKELKLELICGDALEQIRYMEDESIDLVVTDPPYNLSKNYGNNNDKKEFEEYLEFSRAWLYECKRVLKPSGTIYVFMGMRYISYIYIILEKELGLNFNSWITWYYTQGIGKIKGFSPRHDDILMFTKSKDFIFNLDSIRVPQKFYRSINNMRGANPGNVWEFSHMHYCNSNRQSHPTQKPEGLFERMILASSNVGGTVLDPFVGSGTSLRVCQQLKRNCIGIDINPEFVELARTRLTQNFDGFDSTDTRMMRVPYDLNDEDIRNDYIRNHINWFLKNHDCEVADFLKSVSEKYGKKISSEQMELFSRSDT